MAQGTIIAAVVGRGFGFIARPDAADIFFHSRDLRGGLEFGEHLLELDVAFDIGDDPRTGKPRAFNVRPARA